MHATDALRIEQKTHEKRREEKRREEKVAPSNGSLATFKTSNSQPISVE
tara:strand:- start:674 stop:820 length:147 start_codon:yes stop_codon:yes gene_type:complete